MSVREPFFKRPFDFSLSLLGLILSAPLWLVISLAICLSDGFPILYNHERAGKGRKAFKMYKFRSMVKEAEAETGAVWASENDHRVTKVGRLLRNSALDELPQLINILKGDMSFVGPRPERPGLLAKFLEEAPDFELRCLVRPGLTGLAQIYGQYDTPPEGKLKYDMLYIEKCSFWLDLKLLFRSLWVTSQGGWEHGGRNG